MVGGGLEEVTSLFLLHCLLLLFGGGVGFGEKPRCPQDDVGFLGCRHMLGTCLGVPKLNIRRSPVLVATSKLGLLCPIYSGREVRTSEISQKRDVLILVLFWMLKAPFKPGRNNSTHNLLVCHLYASFLPE